MDDLPAATDLTAEAPNQLASALHDSSSSTQSLSPQYFTSEHTPDYDMPRGTLVYADASPDQQLLLDGLNDDVLTIILDLLFDLDRSVTPWSHYMKPYFRRHTSTLNLSLVNRRMRYICIPKLFRNIFRMSKAMGQLNRQLKDIEINTSILSCVR